MPDQSPRNYTNYKLSRDEINLVSKGPKDIVIPEGSDFYEMHAMYRKMVFFLSINKYNDKYKLKQLQELDKILNCEINDNYDYDNPLIPPNFRDKNDNIRCDNPTSFISIYFTVSLQLI